MRERKIDREAERDTRRVKLRDREAKWILSGGSGMLHDVFVLILYTEMNYKIYPRHYFNLNGKFNTNNHTYCKENKEGNQEN